MQHVIALFMERILQSNLRHICLIVHLYSPASDETMLHLTFVAEKMTQFNHLAEINSHKQTDTYTSLFRTWIFTKSTVYYPSLS